MTDNTQKVMMEQSHECPGCLCSKRKRMEEEFVLMDWPVMTDGPGASKPRPRKKRRTDIKPKSFGSLYVTGKKLGEGSFGAVFKGTRRSDGLKVAVKFVQKEDEMEYVRGANSRRVPIEVALIESMSCPPVKHIIQIIEWFDEPEQYILVLERPRPCTDLDTFMRTNGGRLTEDMARTIMRQAVLAARKCHKKGVLHRDMKPENFLINPNTLEAKLIDFGCGDWVKRAGYKHYAGTAYYIPPEFLRKRRYHAKPATIWGLGVLLFRMVCGFLPFKNKRDIMWGRLHFKDGLSKECCDLIRQCLQLKPNKRPRFYDILVHDWLVL